MKRSTYLRNASLGGVWFALVTGVSLPLLMSALPKPFAPNNMVEAGGLLTFALLLFGLPAGIVGFALANRMAHSTHSVRVFSLGAVLVLVTNLLAGAGLSALGSQFVSLRSVLEQAVGGAASFLLLDVLLFKGAPFLLGGLAALAFRAGIHRVGWAQSEPWPAPR